MAEVKRYHKTFEADYIGAYLEDVSIATPGVNVWTKITPSWVEINRNNWTMTATGEFTYDANLPTAPNNLTTRAFQCIFSAGGELIGGGNDDTFDFSYSVNGGAVSTINRSICYNFSTARCYSAVYVFFVDLSPGDYLELWTRNKDNGSDIEIHRGTFFIKSV
jgi:hypothetical protein